MKHGQFYGTMVLACLLWIVATGCGKDSSTQEKLENVKVETREAAQEVKNYSFAQKSELSQKLKRELDAIQQELDQLAAKVDKADEAGKAAGKPMVQSLREKIDRLGRNLADMNGATESTWDSVSKNCTKAYDEVKDGFNQARHWVSEKIAP